MSDQFLGTVIFGGKIEVAQTQYVRNEVIKCTNNFFSSLMRTAGNHLSFKKNGLISDCSIRSTQIPNMLFDMKMAGCFHITVTAS